MQLEVCPVMVASLQAGHIVDVPMLPSIAEGLHGGVEKDCITFSYIQKCNYFSVFNSNLSLVLEPPVLLVSEEDLKKTMALALCEHKFVLEGSGAAALAALVKYSSLFTGRKVYYEQQA